MKEIAIIFTPEVREQAAAALLKQGKEVASDFSGPIFKSTPGVQLYGHVAGGVYNVEVNNSVNYVYPLHTISRIKETL